MTQGPDSKLGPAVVAALAGVTALLAAFGVMMTSDLFAAERAWRTYVRITLTALEVILFPATHRWEVTHPPLAIVIFALRAMTALLEIRMKPGSKASKMMNLGPPKAQRKALRRRPNLPFRKRSWIIACLLGRQVAGLTTPDAELEFARRGDP